MFKKPLAMILSVTMILTAMSGLIAISASAAPTGPVAKIEFVTNDTPGQHLGAVETGGATMANNASTEGAVRRQADAVDVAGKSAYWFPAQNKGFNITIAPGTFAATDQLVIFIEYYVPTTGALIGTSPTAGNATVDSVATDGTNSFAFPIGSPGTSNLRLAVNIFGGGNNDGGLKGYTCLSHSAGNGYQPANASDQWALAKISVPKTLTTAVSGNIGFTQWNGTDNASGADGWFIHSVTVCTAADLPAQNPPTLDFTQTSQTVDNPFYPGEYQFTVPAITAIPSGTNTMTTVTGGVTFSGDNYFSFDRSAFDLTVGTYKWVVTYAPDQTGDTRIQYSTTAGTEQNYIDPDYAAGQFLIDHPGGTNPEEYTPIINHQVVAILTNMDFSKFGTSNSSIHMWTRGHTVASVQLIPSANMTALAAVVTNALTDAQLKVYTPDSVLVYKDALAAGQAMVAGKDTKNGFISDQSVVDDATAAITDAEAALVLMPEVDLVGGTPDRVIVDGDNQFIQMNPTADWSGDLEFQFAASLGIAPDTTLTDLKVEIQYNYIDKWNGDGYTIINDSAGNEIVNKGGDQTGWWDKDSNHSEGWRYGTILDLANKVGGADSAVVNATGSTYDLKLSGNATFYICYIKVTTGGKTAVWGRPYEPNDGANLLLVANNVHTNDGDATRQDRDPAWKYSTLDGVQVLQSAASTSDTGDGSNYNLNWGDLSFFNYFEIFPQGTSNLNVDVEYTKVDDTSLNTNGGLALSYQQVGSTSGDNDLRDTFNDHGVDAGTWVTKSWSVTDASYGTRDYLKFKDFDRQTGLAIRYIRIYDPDNISSYLEFGTPSADKLFPTLTDKSALNDALAAAQAKIDTNNYATDAAAFQSALKAAQDTNDDVYTDQDTIDAAVTALNAAVAALIPNHVEITWSDSSTPFTLGTTGNLSFGNTTNVVEFPAGSGNYAVKMSSQNQGFSINVDPAVFAADPNGRWTWEITMYWPDANTQTSNAASRINLQVCGQSYIFTKGQNLTTYDQTVTVNGADAGAQPLRAMDMNGKNINPIFWNYNNDATAGDFAYITSVKLVKLDLATPDTSYLVSQIAAAQTYDNVALYTLDSVKALRAMIAEAQALVDDPNSTQADIDAETTKLANAVNFQSAGCILVIQQGDNVTLFGGKADLGDDASDAIMVDNNNPKGLILNAPGDNNFAWQTPVGSGHWLSILDPNKVLKDSTNVTISVTFYMNGSNGNDHFYLQYAGASGWVGYKDNSPYTTVGGTGIQGAGAWMLPDGVTGNIMNKYYTINFTLPISTTATPPVLSLPAFNEANSKTTAPVGAIAELGFWLNGNDTVFIKSFYAYDRDNTDLKVGFEYNPIVPNKDMLQDQVEKATAFIDAGQGNTDPDLWATLIADRDAGQDVLDALVDPLNPTNDEKAAIADAYNALVADIANLNRNVVIADFTKGTPTTVNGTLKNATVDYGNGIDNGIEPPNRDVIIPDTTTHAVKLSHQNWGVGVAIPAGTFDAKPTDISVSFYWPSDVINLTAASTRVWLSYPTAAGAAATTNLIFNANAAGTPAGYFPTTDQIVTFTAAIPDASVLNGQTVQVNFWNYNNDAATGGDYVYLTNVTIETATPTVFVDKKDLGAAIVAMDNAVANLANYPAYSITHLAADRAAAWAAYNDPDATADVAGSANPNATPPVAAGTAVLAAQAAVDNMPDLTTLYNLLKDRYSAAELEKYTSGSVKFYNECYDLGQKLADDAKDPTIPVTKAQVSGACGNMQLAHDALVDDTAAIAEKAALTTPLNIYTKSSTDAYNAALTNEDGTGVEDIEAINDGGVAQGDLDRAVAALKEARTGLVLIGDVNHDGKVDTTDARMILQYIVQKIAADDPNFDQDAANVDFSAKIDTTDARMVLQYIVKKIPQFTQPTGQ